MAAPLKPLIVAAKDTLLVTGTYVTFRNLTAGGKETVEGNDGEAIATPTGWSVGDEISMEVTGKYNSSAKITISKGAATNTFSLSEDTSTPAINL